MANLNAICESVSEFLRNETLDLGKPPMIIEHNYTKIYVTNSEVNFSGYSETMIKIEFCDPDGWVLCNIEICMFVENCVLRWATYSSCRSSNYSYRTVVQMLSDMGLEIIKNGSSVIKFKPRKFMVDTINIENNIGILDYGTLYLLCKNAFSQIIHDNYTVNKLYCETLELHGVIDSMISVRAFLLRLSAIKRKMRVSRGTEVFKTYRKIVVTMETKNPEIKLCEDALMKYENLSALRILCNNKLTFTFDRELQTRKNWWIIQKNLQKSGQNHLFACHPYRDIIYSFLHKK